MRAVSFPGAWAVPGFVEATQAGRRGWLSLRTRELAALAGRIPPDVAQADYEQAKCELTGESAPERQDAVLDAGR